jgi:succinyl-CoA synthetase alpha subunit
MRMTETLAGIPGIRFANLTMGTAANKQILEEAGRLMAEARGATPDDLMIVLEAESDGVLTTGLARAESLLSGGEEGWPSGESKERRPRTLAMALEEIAGANLVQISTPGPYAGGEALKAVRRGLHVFLFSDNVPLAQEIFLKQAARRKGLLVMGPDCGTALIGGVPLGFANAVRRGAIGLVAASGTGLQQVTCLIHRLGEGASHGIGTGSRDLSEAVGGITTAQGLEALLHDPGTRVIILVSKPPSPTVAAQILDRVRGSLKPVVVLFLGGDPGKVLAVRATPASTLEEAARAAVALLRGETPKARDGFGLPRKTVRAETCRLSGDQRYIRGLFSGGTFCAEAQVVWRGPGLQAFSNVPLDPSFRLANVQESREHTAIDMGSDEFTVGRPHPMIDFRYRVERLLSEAADPAVAVILLDVVLGHGAHADPASVLVPAIREAKAIAGRDGRYLSVVASVVGRMRIPNVFRRRRGSLPKRGCFSRPATLRRQP